MLPFTSTLRAASRQPGDRLNILVSATHERYESNLARTGQRFWAYRHPQLKNWNPTFAPVPDNYILLNPERGTDQMPPDVEIDLVLSQSKFGQFQLLSPIAQRLGVPLISLEHTAVPPLWPRSRRNSVASMRGDLNVFISDFGVSEWGFDPSDPTVRVVRHGIDATTFRPSSDGTPRESRILSIVNDWVNRDYFCGFNVWKEATRGLPVQVVGDTPGLSKPANGVADLVSQYQRNAIFVNTSLVSPIPTSLLEAMSCGCCVVSLDTCAIPEAIKHEVNGLLASDAVGLRRECRRVLADPTLAEGLGRAARETVLRDYSLRRFVSEWDEVFAEAVSRGVGQ